MHTLREEGFSWKLSKRISGGVVDEMEYKSNGNIRD